MNKDINVINKKKSYNMKYCKKKFIPTAWFFDVKNQTDENPYDFFCYYEEGIWDKYGLHYIEHNGNEIEHIHRKGKKYGYVAVVKNDDENIPENRIRIDGVRSYRTSFY